MDRVGKLLLQASKLHLKQKDQYDFSKLSTDALKEIIRPETIEARILEILEPVRRW